MSKITKAKLFVTVPVTVEVDGGVTVKDVIDMLRQNPPYTEVIGFGNVSTDRKIVRHGMYSYKTGKMVTVRRSYKN